MNIFASFLLVPSDKLPLVQVGWTLIHELYFYFVYFFIFLFFPESSLVYALSGWGACVFLLGLLTGSSSPFLSLISNPLTVEFLGGCFLAVMYRRSEKNKLEVEVLVFIACASLLASVAGYDYYRTTIGTVAPSGWWRILINGLPALSITYSLIYAERKGFVLNSALSRVGNASYSIYLSHLFTINVVGRIWKFISVDRLFDNAVFILVSLIMVLVVGFMSYLLVENTLLNLSRKIVKPLCMG